MTNAQINKDQYHTNLNNKRYNFIQTKKNNFQKELYIFKY